MLLKVVAAFVETGRVGCYEGPAVAPTISFMGGKSITEKNYKILNIVNIV